MLNRFLLYFFGVAFGLLLVELMFPERLKDYVNYFSITIKICGILDIKTATVY